MVLTLQKAGLIFTLFLTIGIINIIMYILYCTKYEANFGDIGLLDVVNQLACWGKNSVMLSNCTTTSDLSTRNVIFASIGVIMLSHDVMMEFVAVMGIIICCASLFYAAMHIQENQMDDEADEFAHVTPAELTNLRNLAEDLSKFIGESLLGYLLLHGLVTPTELDNMFSGSAIAFLSIILLRGLLFLGLVYGSLGALRVCIFTFLFDYTLLQVSATCLYRHTKIITFAYMFKHVVLDLNSCSKYFPFSTTSNILSLNNEQINVISDAISSREHPTLRPVGSAVLRGYIRDFLFKQSTGVGLPGLFVINFKILFSVSFLLCTIIALLFSAIILSEITKTKNN